MYISISSYTYTYRYIHIHINIYIHTSSTATTTMTHPHIHRGGGGTRNQRKSAASETSRAPPQPHNHRGGGDHDPSTGGGGGGRRCTIYTVAPVTQQFQPHISHHQLVANTISLVDGRPYKRSPRFCKASIKTYGPVQGQVLWGGFKGRVPKKKTLTLPEIKNMASENMASQKEISSSNIFQPLIFMGYVSFREGKGPKTNQPTTWKSTNSLMSKWRVHTHDLGRHRI